MRQRSDRDLMRRAVAAARHAHAPYSAFPVGAAVETASGRIFCGCNVENASYGLTVCAERTALLTAVAAGHRAFRRLAVAGGRTGPAYPCGACRQVLAEFCPEDFRILLAPLDAPDRVVATTLGRLFPKAFRLP